MAAGVHQDRGLKELLQDMDDQTDAEVEREERGLMMSTEFQEPADIVLPLENAVCRLRIAGAVTRDAPGIGAEGHGATLLLTTGGTDFGGGAGEENDLHQSKLPLESLSRGLAASKILLAVLSQV